MARTAAWAQTGMEMRRVDLGDAHGIADVSKRKVEGILIFWFGQLGGVSLVSFTETKNNSKDRQGRGWQPLWEQYPGDRHPGDTLEFLVTYILGERDKSFDVGFKTVSSWSGTGYVDQAGSVLLPLQCRN